MATKNKSLDPKSLMLIEEASRLLVQKVGGTFKPALDFLRLELSERVNSSSGNAREEMRKIQAALDKIMIEAPRNLPAMLEEELRRATRGNENLAAPSDLLSSLSLVDEDTLEEEIGIKELIARLRETCGPELTALDKRMGVLLGQPDLRDTENPIGPDTVCAALRRAMSAAGTPAEKRALYRHLHPHIKSAVQEAYRAINELLAKQGVLSVIQAEKPRSSPQPARPAAAESVSGGAPMPHAQTAMPAPHPQTQVQAAAGANAAGAGIFDTLMSLISRAGQAAFTGQGTPMPPGGAGAGNLPPGDWPAIHLPGTESVPAGQVAAGGEGVIPPGMVLAPAQLMQNLTLIQRGQIGAVAGAAPTIDQGQLTSGTVNVLYAIRDNAMAQNVPQVDAITIDIVARLFDFILGDPNIADPIKAQVGRLQIPVLKAAMLNKEFFAVEDHPTRKLLDTIAKGALGWNARNLDKDPLFRKVGELVQKILDNFEDSLAIFDEANTELTGFLAQDDQKADVITSFSAKAVYEKELRESAAELANTEVEKRTVATLPKLVSYFLTDCWRAVLADAYQADEYKEGNKWRMAVQTMDELIWSVAPKPTHEQRLELKKRLPLLMGRIKGTLETHNISKDAIDNFLSSLVKHISESRQRMKEGPQRKIPLEPDESKGELPMDMPTMPAFAVETRARDTTEMEPVPLPADAPVKEEDGVVTVYAGDFKKIEIPDGFASAQAKPEIQGDEHDQCVVAMKKGTWLDFTLDDGKVIRLRLSWVSPLRGMYLFSDRDGMNAIKISPKGLAKRLRNGTAKPTEDRALVERAVSGVMKSLQAA